MHHIRKNDTGKNQDQINRVFFDSKCFIVTLRYFIFFIHFFIASMPFDAKKENKNPYKNHHPYPNMESKLSHRHHDNAGKKNRREYNVVLRCDEFKFFGKPHKPRIFFEKIQIDANEYNQHNDKKKMQLCREGDKFVHLI